MKYSWRGPLALVIVFVVVVVVVITQISVARTAETTRLPEADSSVAGVTNAEAVENVEAEAPPDAVAELHTSEHDGTHHGPLNELQAKITTLEATVQEDPSNVDALTELAGVYFQLRLYPRAADIYADALEFDPNNARLRTDLGSSLLYQGMLGLAKREYVRAIEADPDIPDPHYNLAVILSHSSPQDISGALSEWNEVVRLGPESDLAISALQYINSYEPQEEVEPNGEAHP